MPDEERAVRSAKDMAKRHVGVITWSRPARPDIGEFGEPTELWRAGDVPESFPRSSQAPAAASFATPTSRDILPPGGMKCCARNVSNG